MTSKKSRVLVIDDEPDIAFLLEMLLIEQGYEVVKTISTFEAEQLDIASFDIVLSDIHMPDRSGLTFLEEISGRLSQRPAWVFITGNVDPEIIERACRLGAIDVLQKPFKTEHILQILKRISRRHGDTIQSIMDTVQAISGITLDTEKRMLVETRLMRRARFLQIDGIEDYAQYFTEHRSEEIPELVSLMTTHTTEFFREPDHFDFLFDHLLPGLLQRGGPIRIWSAACSSGEEVYSLAILLAETFRKKGMREVDYPFQVMGTDIDFQSVERAKKGIFNATAVGTIHPELRKRYFDQGTGDISHLYRIKEAILRRCSFQQHNLLSSKLPFEHVDIIFLRNVLIYFRQEDVLQIVTDLDRALVPSGVLFLGHSESISNLKTGYKVIGNSVYQTGGAAIETKAPAGVPERLGPPTIKVLIIDDSATVRRMLRHILNQESGFDIIGEAEDPLHAERLLKALKPDVMTLDIHMPKMDGLSYLRSIQHKNYPPIVMISSVSYEDGIEAFKCFELGAVDYIEKPQGIPLAAEVERMRAVVRGALQHKRPIQRRIKEVKDQGQELIRHVSAPGQLIALGASTGGIEALRQVLTRFPAEAPPTLVVQHMPAAFSRAFAERLDHICKVKVREAEDGWELKQGNVYIAPGSQHMGVREQGGKLYIQLSNEAPIRSHRPSVDYLFQSLVPLKKYSIAAALLTGMGQDGADGLLALRQRGAHTIAQDEESCVVYGMPHAAVEREAACEVVPLVSVAYHIFRGLQPRRKIAS